MVVVVVEKCGKGELNYVSSLRKSGPPLSFAVP